MNIRQAAICLSAVLALSACGGSPEPDGPPEQSSQDAEPAPSQGQELQPLTATEYTEALTAAGVDPALQPGIESMAMTLCSASEPEQWLFLSLRQSAYVNVGVEALGIQRHCLDKADVYFDAVALQTELEADPSAYCAGENVNYGLQQLYCRTG